MSSSQRFRRYLERVQKIFTEPFPVVFFRLRQEARLLLMRRLNLWQRLQKTAEVDWASRAIKYSPALRLIDADNLEATRVFVSGQTDTASKLQQSYADLVAGKVSIFNTENRFDRLPEPEVGIEWPWRADWRFGHEWPNQYYKSFNHYDIARRNAFDVKFPWELSRFGFLVSPALWAALDGDRRWDGQLQNILKDWISKNPVAGSVNWNSMECSVRSINLALIVMLTTSSPNSENERAELLSVLMLLCELHGKFIYRNIEYTGVRGNHFAANIVALLLLGIMLANEIGEARKWIDYSRRHINQEILQQFSADGVHFEKSLPYHRFVLQLFLLAAMALKSAGWCISEEAERRLNAACHYLAACVRPDESTPVWGDNDDASVFCFAANIGGDHAAVLSLAGAFFGEAFCDVSGNKCESIEVPLLVRDGLGCLQRAKQRSVAAVEYFSDGGMFVARQAGFYFLTDVGEVGLRGRGGHGHLDALSFELALAGTNVVIDAGSFIYTADAAARDQFRSTRAHNVVQIDGVEMGTLDAGKMWQLGNEAEPYEISLQTQKGFSEISARHDGYLRLDDPVAYKRTFRIQPAKNELRISDEFECAGDHTVERFFHFAHDLDASICDDTVILSTSGVPRFVVTWSAGTATLENDWVSQHYASKLPAQTLRLHTELSGNYRLETCITIVS